jgi:hypothetical protein
MRWFGPKSLCNPFKIPVVAERDEDILDLDQRVRGRIDDETFFLKR